MGSRFSEPSLDDVIRLRALGFTDSLILETVVVTALNNFANVLQMGLGIEHDFDPPLAFEQKKAHLQSVAFRSSYQTPTTYPAMEPGHDPDTELVTQARAGSLEAFEELVRRHSRLVYRALAAMLGNQDRAQDAMQDVMLSAYQHIAGFQARSKFSTWLVSIARNKAIEYLRKCGNEVSLDETSPAAKMPTFGRVNCGIGSTIPSRRTLAWRYDSSSKRVLWPFPQSTGRWSCFATSSIWRSRN